MTHIYDPAGNRTVKIDSGARTTATYDTANRLINSIDGTGRTTFTFDATGNQTRQVAPSNQITTSTWDYENLNKTVILPSLSRVTLVYNADKLRVEKDTATSTAKFVYDGQNIVLETDGTNATQAVYTLDPAEFGKLVAQRQLVAGSWVPVYYAFDGLGSADSLTDSSQVITDTYTYFAFGVVKASTGTTTNRFTWVGELGYVRDTETGEYQLHVRQYQPDRARFKSKDPAGLASDVNLGRLVANDVVNRTDPSGLGGSYLDGSKPYLGSMTIRYVVSKWGPDVEMYVGFRDLKTDIVSRPISMKGSGGRISRSYRVHFTKLQDLLSAKGTDALDAWTEEDWDTWFQQNDEMLNAAKPLKPRLSAPQQSGMAPEPQRNESAYEAIEPGSATQVPTIGGKFPLTAAPSTRFFTHEERDEWLAEIDSLGKDSFAFVTDWLPFLSDLKDWISIAGGKDIITDEDLTGLQIAVMAIPVIPAASMLRVLKRLRSFLAPRLKGKLGLRILDVLDGRISALEKAASSLPPLRQAYISEVESLKDKAAQLRAAGNAPEQIARALHQLRRDIGIKYKDLTPAETLEKIYQRNLEKYGDKLGPTIEYLRGQGKSWEEIIQSASRTGGADLGLAKPK